MSEETEERMTTFAVDADGFGHVWLRFDTSVVAMRFTPDLARQLALALRRKSDEAERTPRTN